MTSILEPFESKRHPNETGTSSIYASPNNSGSRILITTSEGIEKVTVALEDLTRQVQENTAKTNSNDASIKENKTEINSLDSRLTTVEDTLDTTVETAITSLQTNVANNTNNIANLSTRVTNNETTTTNLSSRVTTNETNIQKLQTNQIPIYSDQLHSLTNLVFSSTGALARAMFPPITSNNLTQADSYIYPVGATKFLHISGRIGGYTNNGTSPRGFTFAIIPYVNLNYLEARTEGTGLLIGNATKLSPYYFTSSADELTGSFSLTIALPALGRATTLNDVALIYSTTQQGPVDSISNLAIGIVSWKQFITGTGSGDYITPNTTDFNIVYS